MSEPALKQRASLLDWMSVFGPCLGAFMVLLDVTMINSSIFKIQGTLGIGVEEGSWTMTSYMVGEIITIPIAGWFSTVFSYRKYLLFNIFFFVLFSVLCGMARSLPFMIFARFFQGLAGGPLITLAGSAVMTRLPVSQRALGLSIFSLTIGLGPTLGPSFGGYIASKYGWPYSFYLNIFPGLLIWGLISHSYEKVSLKLNLLKNGDWLGMTAMGVCMATLTFVLEEGNRKDWLGDKTIFRAALICLVSFITFIWIELKTNNPLINLRLLLKRNFLLAISASTILAGFMLCNLFIIPSYLLQIQGYDSFEVGKVALWSGPIQIPMILTVPLLIRHIQARWLIVLGCVFIFASCFINSRMTNLTASDQLIIPQLLRAFGLSLILGPLAGMALADIELSNMGSAVGLFNLMRTLGGSVAIAAFGAVLNHRYSFHFSRIAEKVSETNYIVTDMLERSSNLYSSKILEENRQAMLMLGKIVNREAFVMAYADVYLALSYSIFVVAILVIMIKVNKAPGSAAPLDH